MCGINGLILKENLSRRKKLGFESKFKLMTKSLNHRGPDDNGSFKEKNFYLGHNRLSIIDLTKAGHQPMSDSSSDIWIVFNGEIYNYIEIREELKKKGYSFKSGSDTEVIIYAYKEWGYDCLKKLNGMFAFCIYDKNKNNFFIARDRLGIKPLFYYICNDFFAFGSEIKSLLALGIKRKPNEGIIYDYLSKGIYDHSSETFFENVFQLEQAHYMIIDANLKPIKKKYWDLVEETKKHKNINPEKELLRLLKDSISLRLRSDVPLGLNLSGGLDSNTLAVFLSEQLRKKGGELRTFTMCFNNKKYDERAQVKEVVDLLKCKNVFTFFSPQDFNKFIQKSVYFQDQPFGGIQTIAYLKNSDYIRNKENVIVLLEGQGGDELFGGYKKYLASNLRDLYKKKNFLKFFIELLAYKKINNLKLNEAFKKVFSKEEGIHTDDTKAVRIECLNQDFLKKFKNRANGFEYPFDSELLNEQYLDLKYLKLPRVLRFNDHMTMAKAVELRVPYLDYRIVELAFSIPSRKKIKHGMGKMILRGLTKNLLTDKIRLRNKVSVVTPQIDWLKNELRSFVEEIINSSSFKKRNYFDAKRVKQAYSDYCSEERPKNSFFIWQWIMLELWFRTYIDKEFKLKNTP